MKNNVMISLTSIQWQDGERTQTELVTKAKRSKEGKFDIISYEDTEATGYEGSVTTIKADDSSAYITREGTANSALSLEVGKKHFCQYETPFGCLQLGVYTHNVDNTITKDGKLYLKYSLDLNAAPLSDNEIIMTIN
ncbi:MAG: DUF1934 domain-containing protein [Ruminococcus sp.]|nr:DUF1934 domain-containing protein [Ruminococcus sp.]